MKIHDFTIACNTIDVITDNNHKGWVGERAN
jgi:hypothetical protein